MVGDSKEVDARDIEDIVGKRLAEQLGMFDKRFMAKVPAAIGMTVITGLITLFSIFGGWLYGKVNDVESRQTQYMIESTEVHVTRGKDIERNSLNIGKLEDQNKEILKRLDMIIDRLPR